MSRIFLNLSITKEFVNLRKTLAKEQYIHELTYLKWSFWHQEKDFRLRLQKWRIVTRIYACETFARNPGYCRSVYFWRYPCWLEPGARRRKIIHMTPELTLKICKYMQMTAHRSIYCQQTVGKIPTWPAHREPNLKLQRKSLKYHIGTCFNASQVRLMFGKQKTVI